MVLEPEATTVMDEPVSLSELNSHLQCKLCNGYLIEATTIIECLHTFCKSCIVKYLEDEYKCPVCQLLIHQSHPLSYIMLDRTIQDIVYKAVPGLQEAEQDRIEEFYISRDLPVPSFNSNTNSPTPNDEEKNSYEEKGANCNFHRDDTQVGIIVEEGGLLPPLEKKFLQCSIYTTIKTLKSFISHKLYGSGDKSDTIDIFCQKEIMGKDHSLEFVLCTRWRMKDLPLVLEYRPRIDMV